jgi:hypothetical protein
MSELDGCDKRIQVRLMIQSILSGLILFRHVWSAIQIAGWHSGIKVRAIPFISEPQLIEICNRQGNEGIIRVAITIATPPSPQRSASEPLGWYWTSVSGLCRVSSLVRPE